MVVENDNNNNNAAESLSVDYFLDILKNELGNFDEILQFKVASAVNTGENYMTQLMRVNFKVAQNDATTKEVSYMSKIFPNGGIMAENIDKWKVFAKERNTYINYIPEFEQMYKKAGKQISFGAKLLGNKNVDTPKEILIFEDLCRRGFRNMPRQNGLDVLHSKATLEKLAQFHAASACRYVEKGSYPANYNKCLNVDIDEFKEFRVNNAKILCEHLQLYGNFNYLNKKLKRMAELLPDQYQILAPLDENEFAVLNHGDMWSNNIMFRHDEQGNIVETVFVDYQMSRYGSPAQDLLYFILSSTAIEIKFNSFDYLIHFYHEKLLENLKLLNYSGKMPSLKNLHISLLKNGSWGFTMLTILLPIVLLEKNDDANLDNILNNEKNDLNKLMFNNTRFVAHAKQMLPWLDNRGLLDYNEES